MERFLFWWSVLSTVLGIILMGLTIWQYFAARSQKDKAIAQVKVWMQDANGISNGLNRIVKDNIDGRYTTANDVCNAVWALQATAFALYQSFYEERCVTEEEYKERQKEIQEQIKATQNSTLNAPGPTVK